MVHRTGWAGLGGQRTVILRLTPAEVRGRHESLSSILDHMSPESERSRRSRLGTPVVGRRLHENVVLGIGRLESPTASFLHLFADQMLLAHALFDRRNNELSR